MKSSGEFRLLIARDRLHVAGAMWLRNAIAVVFVALVAYFLTAPVGAVDSGTGTAGSAFDAPLPMPASLQLEPVLWE